MAPQNALMAKKRKGGQHKTPRQPIQFPKDWLAIVRQMAERRRQPMLWVLISLVEQGAKADKITPLPPMPWEAAPEKDK